MMHSDHITAPKAFAGPQYPPDAGPMSEQHRYMAEGQSCWAEVRLTECATFLF